MTTTIAPARSVKEVVIDLILAAECLEEGLRERDRRVADHRARYFADAEREDK